MATLKKSGASGITVRFSPPVRDRVMQVAAAEHRSAAAYIEHLVEQDLKQRGEEDRVIRVYVAEDAPEWTGTVVRSPDETPEDHAERTRILNSLFGS